MKLTLIQRSSFHELSLPDKVSGQFFVNCTSFAGSLEPILSVLASDGRWKALAGKNALICNVQGKKLGDDKKSYTVLEYGHYIIRRSPTMEEYTLLVSDDSQSMLLFHRYNADGAVTIGSDEHCDIVLHSDIVPPNAAVIGFSEKKITLEASQQCFVNSELVKKCELIPSDIVYLYGFRFVIGRGIISIDNAPLVSVNTETSLSKCIPYKKAEGAIEQSFDDIDRKDFFYVSPHFSCEEKYPEIEILPPPAGSKSSDSPVALALGPAFTMGVASASTAAFTLMNGMEQGRELTDMMPTLIMSGSMVMCSMLWPVINKTYSKAKGSITEKKRKKIYLKYLDKKEKEIKELLEKQRKQLVLENPTIEQLAERADNRLATLWERRVQDEDFLRFYAGNGRVESAFELKKPKETIHVEYDPLFEQMDSILDRQYYLDDAPVTISLRDNRITGIVGNRAKVIEYAQNIIMQLTTLCSYSDLKIVLICSRSEEQQWSYLRWLPHSWSSSKDFRYIACDVAELKSVSSVLEKELNLRDGDGNKISCGAHYVVICADQELCGKTNLVSNIISGENSLFSVLALYNETRNLPNECSLILQLCREEFAEQKSGDASRTLCINGREYAREMYIRPVSSDKANFTQQAVNLANIKLGSVEGGFKLPDMMTFTEMYKVSNVHELNCLSRWKENNPVISLAAPLGLDSHGDLMTLDLHQNAHGPHGLIAGTTGSGKSEFIMTMIMSLAVNYSPLELSFLLIDYKGGALSTAFVNLPHVAGIITNLDGAAIARSMICIRSERQRRQELFNETGKQLDTTVNDIYKYQRLYREGKISRPLQHLFIISDEFAELKDQCPEFMDELNSAARIGRSLGMHLILATQKPSGVVTGQIWSNSRFRVCLKVQEASDSKDVIMCPDAAYITQTGRYFLQVGYNEVFEMGQSAWAGASYNPDYNPEDNVDDSVVVIDNTGTVIKEASNEIRKQAEKSKHAKEEAADGKKEKPSQMEAIVSYLSQLCENEGLHSDRLWLDPIPEVIYASELEEKYGYTTPDDLIMALIGEYDIPQEQSQKPLTLSLMEGNALVYGSSGYGKTMFLIAYIYDILNRYTAEKAVFYILDFSAETLRAFEGYNAVGTFITSGEPEKVEIFFNFLLKEINWRKAKLAAAGVDFTQYIKQNDDIPAMNIIIANYGSFKEEFEKERYDSLVEVLSRDASKYGVYFLLTSVSTTGVRMKIMENFSNIFALNLNDCSYSNVLPKVKKMVPTDCKGRGLCCKEEVYEFQTCYITHEQDVFSFIRERAGVINRRSKCSAKGISPLPDVVSADYLKRFITTENNVVVAIDKLSLQPVYMDMSRFINVFTCNNGSYDLEDTAGALIQLIENDYPLYVFDAGGTLKTKTEDYYTGDKIHDGLKKLAKLMGKRENSDYVLKEKPVVCVLSGFSDIMREDAKKREGEAEQILPLLLMHANLGVHFVIFGDCLSFSRYTSMAWFKSFPIETYFWLGGGINCDSMMFRHDNMANISEVNVENSGYSFVNGVGTLAKFISLGEER